MGIECTRKEESESTLYKGKANAKFWRRIHDPGLGVIVKIIIITIIIIIIIGSSSSSSIVVVVVVVFCI